MKNRIKEMQETNKKIRGRDGETRRNILAFCSLKAKTAREIMDGLSLSKTTIYKILKILIEEKRIIVLDTKTGKKSLYFAKGYKGAPPSVVKPKERAKKKDNVSFPQRIPGFVRANPGANAREEGRYLYFPLSRNDILLNFRIWDDAVRRVVRRAM